MAHPEARGRGCPNRVVRSNLGTSSAHSSATRTERLSPRLFENREKFLPASVRQELANIERRHPVSSSSDRLLAERGDDRALEVLLEVVGHNLDADLVPSPCSEQLIGLIVGEMVGDVDPANDVEVMGEEVIDEVDGVPHHRDGSNACHLDAVVSCHDLPDGSARCPAARKFY